MPSNPESSLRRALHRRRLALPSVDPGVFLDRFRGEVRGFWGRGERWVAWAGALHEFTRSGRTPEGVAGEDPRFADLRAQVTDTLGAWREGETGGAEDLGPPRVFGGFSFLRNPRTGGAWTGFPAARFFLPRFLLEGGPEGCGLVVQSLERIDPVVGGSSEGTDPVASGSSGVLHELRAHLLGTPAPPRVLIPRASERLPDANGVERRAWGEAVAAVLSAIEEGTLEKAVLARIQDVELERVPDVPALLRFLRAENPRAHVFLFQLPEGPMLFGAAPEVLAELRGGQLHATAVAGSVARGVDAEGDRERADALMASEKDRAEHRMTVEEMSHALSDRLTELEVASGPRILTLSRIQHLESPIAGAVRAGEDVLSVVEALHPTPAVCGRPRSVALALIRSREPFSRGWYAGPVGWFDPAGEGDFVPALRIGVGQGTRWRLFAGAGIVAGSDPALEWEETALKFEPALRALRAGAAAPVDAMIPGAER